MMKNRYLPMTDQDQTEMLAAVGAETIEDLFQDIPEKIRFKGELPVSSKLDEYALTRHMSRLAGRNANADTHASFLGAGIYDHHVPSVINHMISRSEFYTAYTPYQPEISQGELQAIFEFQSYICELTGMAVANASMYDGATAFAEAGNLAAGATRRKKLIVSRSVHPESRQVLASYAHGLNIEVVEIGVRNGITDMEALAAAIGEDTAAVMMQSPNFFGSVEDIKAAADLAHAKKGLLIVSSNPISLGLLEAPGNLGADIVVGDAQPLGISGSYGGPTCGFFAVSKDHMRRMPGRIVGQTTDRYGRRGFVLTLQAREQHIRREKATSNICSNQALLALSASVYMSLLGKQGMLDVAQLNLQKSHYTKNKLTSIKGVSTPFTAPTFNEFVIKLPEGTNIDQLQSKLLDAGFIGGYDLAREYPEFEGHMLIAVTERRTKEEIDEFTGVLEGLL
ncbi:aminomethyl-transferring glycine dehydrogenase subunit GcvPA [Paenibacillus sp. Marseille-Q4541]|uniref:aminomethyl-transferring glycine dehydrogenase subunit GcvPA n=1 Tax=Paenibacillus sp. Marseille-Q4541 TaxID=2831522 RepID=UPI0024B61CA0|nr:aminomethyl-transferring glycine dehydrogenase subunit GcvPA [Paenibacillus sp. Marseille-Q4541]